MKWLRSASQADVFAQQGRSQLLGHVTGFHHKPLLRLPWSCACASIPLRPFTVPSFLPCPLVAQVRDQAFTGGNLALKRSHETGTPVRVFRGSKVTGKLQYTYEGLYKVTDVRHEVRRGLGEGWGEALGRCELREVQGRRQTPLASATEPLLYRYGVLACGTLDLCRTFPRAPHGAAHADRHRRRRCRRCCCCCCPGCDRRQRTGRWCAGSAWRAFRARAWSHFRCCTAACTATCWRHGG